MDKLKELEKQLGKSKAHVAEVQQKFSEGAISPEEAIRESMKALEAIGEVFKKD